MNIIAHRRWLNRIWVNVDKYLDGYINWKDIQEIKYSPLETLDDYDLNLEYIYSINEEWFPYNLLIQRFNNQPLFIEDNILKNIQKNFQIKVTYEIVNNLNLTKLCMSDVLLIMKDNNKFNNTELYFLNMMYMNERYQQFDKIFHDDKNLLKGVVKKIENLKNNLLEKYENILY